MIKCLINPSTLFSLSRSSLPSLYTISLPLGWGGAVAVALVELSVVLFLGTGGQIF